MRRRKRLVALAALTIAAGFGMASPAAAHHEPAVRFRPMDRRVGDLFGLNTSIARRYPHLVQQSLLRIVPLRANWVREEITPDALHRRTDAPYKFRLYDHVVNGELSRHLNVLGLLDFNNTFGHGAHNLMPHQDIVSRTKQFLAFVRAVVWHFRGRISYWQVWNEPDLRMFWAPHRNAYDYAYLLDQSYAAIKSIEPKAQVVIGGPSGADHKGFAFLKRVVALGGRFDIVAAQPYTPYPGPALAREFVSLQEFHKPVWITEMGWTADDSCMWVCGATWGQAGRLAMAYFLAAKSGVSKLFWYDFRDEGTTPIWRDHFGLLDWDMAAKRTYVAYEISAYMLQNRTFTGMDRISPNVMMWRLGYGKGRSYVVVNESADADAKLNLRWPFGSMRAVQDDGTPCGAARNGSIRMVVKPSRVAYLVPARAALPTYSPGPMPPPGAHSSPHKRHRHSGHKRRRTRHTESHG